MWWCKNRIDLALFECFQFFLQVYIALLLTIWLVKWSDCFIRRSRCIASLKRLSTCCASHNLPLLPWRVYNRRKSCLLFGTLRGRVRLGALNRWRCILFEWRRRPTVICRLGLCLINRQPFFIGCLCLRNGFLVRTYGLGGWATHGWYRLVSVCILLNKISLLCGVCCGINSTLWWLYCHLCCRCRRLFLWWFHQWRVALDAVDLSVVGIFFSSGSHTEAHAGVLRPF